MRIAVFCCALIACTSCSRNDGGAGDARLEAERLYESALALTEPVARAAKLESVLASSRIRHKESEEWAALNVLVLRALAEAKAALGEVPAAANLEAERTAALFAVIRGRPAAGWAHAELARDALGEGRFLEGLDLLERGFGAEAAARPDEFHFLDAANSLTAAATVSGDPSIEAKGLALLARMVDLYLQPGRVSSRDQAWRADLLARAARIAIRTGDEAAAARRLSELESEAPSHPDTVELRKLFSSSRAR